MKNVNEEQFTCLSHAEAITERNKRNCEYSNIVCKNLEKLFKEKEWYVEVINGM